MKGYHSETGAPACVKCGSAGGYVNPGDRRPCRRLGLCDACYLRVWNAGQLHEYEQYRVAFDAPRIPSGTVDLDTLTPSSHHVYAPQTPEWQRTVAYEQRRAHEWLAARQLAA